MTKIGHRLICIGVFLCLLLVSNARLHAFVFSGPENRSEGVPSKADRDAKWQRLAQAGNAVLRRQSERTGLAVNSVQYKLTTITTPDGTPAWVLGATSDKDISIVQDKIDISGRPIHSGAEFRGFVYVPVPRLTQVTVLSSGPFEVQFDGRQAFPPIEDATETVSSACFNLPVGHHTIEARWENHIRDGKFHLTCESGDDARIVFTLDKRSDDKAAAQKRLDTALLGVSPTIGESVLSATDVLTTVSPMAKGTYVDGWLHGDEGFVVLTNSSQKHYPTALPYIYFRLEPGGAGEVFSFPAAGSLGFEGEGTSIFPVNFELGLIRLRWSTAEPIGLFHNKGRTFLISRSIGDKAAEYAFLSSQIKEVDIDHTMRRFDRDNHTIIVLPEGTGIFSVTPPSGSPIVIETIGPRERVKPNVWDVAGESWGVSTTAQLIESKEDTARVRIRSEGPFEMSVFPGGGLESIECNGTIIDPSPKRNGDEFRFRLRTPAMYTRLSSNTSFTVAGNPNDPELEDLFCRVILSGSTGKLRSGLEGISRIEKVEEAVEISLIGSLRAGRRSFTVDFDSTKGKIKSVRLVPILIKDIRFHKRTE